MNLNKLKKLLLSLDEKTLKELDLDEFELKELPQSLKNFKNLEKLSIRDNQLTDISIVTQLPNLLQLDVSRNKLKNLPDNICKLKKIEKLDASFNNLEVLPSDFGNLTQLKELRVYNNEITFFPKSFQSLTNLDKLLVAGNPFVNLNYLPNHLEYDSLWNQDFDEDRYLLNLENIQFPENETNEIYFPEESAYWLEKELANFYLNEKICCDLQEEYQTKGFQELYELTLSDDTFQSDIAYEFEQLFEVLQHPKLDSYILPDLNDPFPKYGYQIDEHPHYSIDIPQALDELLLPELNALTWESLCFYLQQPHYFDNNLLTHYLEEDEADYLYQQVKMNPWIWAVTQEGLHLGYVVEGEYAYDI